MPPSEQEILTDYLIQPSALTSIITFEQFQALFPASLQASPQVRSLYRDLRVQRDLVIAEVQANIEEEVRRGKAMRNEIRRARQEAAAAEAEDDDREIELERALFAKESGALEARHTLTSIVPELDNSVTALEAEIQRLKSEEDRLIESIKQTVGALSDLRYGKFSNTHIHQEVLDGLKSLESACDNKT